MSEPFPTRLYRIIYADPPWHYNDHGVRGGVDHHYETMSLRDIKNLPVQQNTYDDCALFMWATYPMIREAFEVIEAWGFTYKTLAFQWVKTTETGKLFYGLGHWTRANTEPCLLAIKGKPKRVDAGVPQVIQAKVREHSRKPDEVRERIVRLMGDLPRIELFARERFEGWDAWGNEV